VVCACAPIAKMHAKITLSKILFIIVLLLDPEGEQMQLRLRSDRCHAHIKQPPSQILVLSD